MMSKLWTLLCIGLVLTSVYGQSCADTLKLRTFYNLSNSLNMPAAGTKPATTIDYCASIKGAAICCTYEDVQSFQAKSDAQIAILTKQASSRDTSFAVAGGTNLTNVTSTLNSSAATFNNVVVAKVGNLSVLIQQANVSGSLNPNYAGFGSFSTLVNPVNAASPTNPVGFNNNPIPASPGTPGNPLPTGNSTGKRMLQQLGSNSQSTSVNIFGVAANLNASLKQLSDPAANVKSDLTTFQKARSTCVVSLYQVQAAAWCLSCNVNASLNGYDKNLQVFYMGTDVCGRLKTACYPYLVASSLQNAVFNVEMLKAALAFATNNLNNGTNPLNQTFTYSGQQPASLPAGCTSADTCSWICSNLFNNGQVNSAALINGGSVASTTSRLLSEDEERQLQSSTNVNVFNPSATEAGTTVTFKDDPSGVNPDLSGNTGNSAMLTYGSVLGGMITMIWSMMM